MQPYITGIQALNYHGYDWHRSYFDFNKSVYKNDKELMEWCDYGIENNIANPYRAFLDYLYHNIHFKKRVPNHRIEMFLFTDEEEKELLRLIDKYLLPILDKEEMELFELWKKYNNGGKYENRSRKKTLREIRRRTKRTH
jgi:hypothetical protein